MRGKTALPLTRRGEEVSSVGVPAGRAELGGVAAPCPGVTPGGTDGGRTNGEPPPLAVED
jgi:hypothetical protein